MEIELERKSTVIFGLPDSGKSTLTNFLLFQFGPAAFMYDTLDEYNAAADYVSYVPKDREDLSELTRIIRAVMKARKYSLVAIDEANRFAEPKPKPLPPVLRDLNDYRAHYELGTIYICRRPTQFHTDIVDLANNLIIFRLDGPHDIDYLNNIKAGLGDAAANLQPYHFILRNMKTGSFIVHKPIDKQYATNKTRASIDH
jgi:hypothetical protein